MESKYLGSLKVLDRKVLLKDPESQGPDELRAAIYQVSISIDSISSLKSGPLDCFAVFVFTTYLVY